MIDQLVEDSKRRNSLQESSSLSDVKFGKDDIKAAEKYINDNPDYSAYHLLLALRKQESAAYDSISDDKKASVLCSALEHLNYLNDWGYLEPGDSHDGEAAKALIQIGKAAIECLKPLLDNKEPAPLFGSEEATISYMYKYRRNDFAARALSQILGVDLDFDRNPDERDKEIDKLKAQLKGK